MSNALQQLGTPDPVQVFLTYMNFSGDVAQTAVVLQVDPSVVSALAAAGNWAGKIKELVKLGDGKDPRELKLSINRAVNYVQADRLRRLIDRVLTTVSAKHDDEILELLTTTGPKGASFSTRPLTDLVKAAAEAQLMTRLALGDVGAGELAEEAKGGSDIALSVMKAMQAATELEVPAAPILRQLP